MKVTVRRNIRRQALIIQNSGQAKDYIGGVLKDVVNFYKYLHSNIGGGWKSEEITIAPINCTISWLEEYFKRFSDVTDYFLILFTGHGSYDSDHGAKCFLQNGEFFRHSWLERQVSIVPTLFLTDSCQGIEKLNEGGMIGQRTFSTTGDSERRSLCREKYDEVLKTLPLGMFVVGSSVSPGEYAEENPNEGGYYVSSLISEANRIGKDISANSGVYGIAYIHNLAAEQVKTLSKGKQTPYLEGYNRSFQPPFMVKL